MTEALDRLSTPLAAHRALMLETVIDVRDPDPKRPPALLSFVFRDAEGAEIEGPHDGFMTSTLYGTFVYVGTPGAQGPLVVHSRTQPPAGAASAEVALYRWRAGAVDLAEGLRLAEPGADHDPEAAPGSVPERFPVLAELEIDVEPFETYQVATRLDCPVTADKRFALAAVRFEDAEGSPLESPEHLPVSDLVGPFRYLQRREDGLPAGPGRFVADARFLAPARAARMLVRVVHWNTAIDLQVVDADLTWLGGPDRVVAEGAADLRLSPRFRLDGRLRARGVSGPRVALIDLRFQDAAGARITGSAEGLQTLDGFSNCAFVRPWRAEAETEADFHVSFVPPPGAVRVAWQIQRWEADALDLVAPVSLDGVVAEAPLLLARLGPEATTCPGLRPAELAHLRRALQPAPAWTAQARGELGLLGEMAAITQPGAWLIATATLDWPARQLGGTRPMLAPSYFDARGVLLDKPALLGCMEHEAAGPCRPATLHFDPSRPDTARLREAFCSPPGAAFVLFHLFTEYRLPDTVRVQAVSLAPGDADTALDGLDTAAMDVAQLQMANQIAEHVWDMPARRQILGALALADPGEKSHAARARSLAEQMTDLDTRWLPDLPPSPPFEPDPDTVLHLFKVIHPDENSGGAVRSRSIVEAQALRGLKPVVCMPMTTPPPQLGVAAETDGTDAATPPDTTPVPDGQHEVVRGGVSVNYLYFTGLGPRSLTPAQELRLETAMHNSVLLRHRAGLVHAASGFRGFETALKGLALARANRLPFVYEVRSFHEHTWRPISAAQMGNSQTRLRIAQENRCMGEADAVVTISQAMVEHLAERGVPREKLFFVPNSVSDSFHALAPMGEVARLRARHGLAGKTVIGYISNMSLREGFAVLLESFARLVQAGQDLHLVMVGSGPERSVIKRQVEKRGLTARVLMPGAVPHEEIRTWYRMIDLFVVPRIADFASDYVTPLKPFEAMAQTVPVIMSDRPVTAEIAGPAGERATVFPAGDPEALAATIAAELANPAALRARAAAARDWVLSERSWSSTVARYDAVYAAARASAAQRLKGETP